MTIFNKKTFLYLIISFFFTGSNLVLASSIDKSDAAFAARNFYEELNPVRNSDLSAAPVLDQAKASCGGFAMSAAVIKEETHHIFEFEGGGYIIMSADDNAPPILGYSFDSEQLNDEIPPQLEAMLEEYDLQIKMIREENLDNPEAQAQWEDLLTSDFDSSGLEVDGDVGALIKTTWSQCNGYNNYAPADGSATCGNDRVPIGCVATAMGQVMKYHNYPATGFGSHSYSSDYGTLSANFDTTYSWGSMLNASGNNAVSKLLYHCAVALNMDFGPGGSGAYTGSVDNVLENYFNYDTAAKYVYKSNYSTSGWRNLIRSQIDAGQPVVYRGSGSGGHAFNVDGYKTGNNTFHLNWGWGGSYNGYYVLEDLTPGGYNFNTGQAAVIDIKPNTTQYLKLSGSIRKGDFNGDGNTDILNYYNGRIRIYLMDGTDIVERTTVATISTAWKIKALTDFNNDGNTDIFWRNSKTGQNTIWLMDGATKLSATSPGTVSISWDIRGTADFDKDGNTDILWRNSKTGQNTIWLMDGTTKLSATSPGTVSISWKIRGTADFDNDGNIDILWRNSKTGQNAIWFMDGTSKLSSTALGTVSTSWDIRGTADFDKDGNTDIFWRNSKTGQNTIWLMDGATKLSANPTGTVSISWDIRGTTDFDKDGNIDILWHQPKTGSVSIWLMNGTEKSTTEIIEQT